MQAPVGVARRKAEQDRPGKSFEQVGNHRLDGGSAVARLVAARQLAEDDGRRARRMPDRRSCVSMRSMRYGRSATSSMNRMCPAGGSNAYGVPSEASKLRQRAAEQDAARLRPGEAPPPGDAMIGPAGSARVSTRVNVSRS